MTLDRRDLLRLAGTAGLATAVGACARPTDGSAVAAQEPSAPAATPAPTSPAPATAAPPAPRTTGLDLLCRDAWGAQPARPGGTPHTLRRMTIHHTAATLGDNANIIARLRQHQRYHQDTQGWIDIAYHVAVDRNGNLFELRDTGIAGDTATDYDTTGHFLVVCEGNFDTEQVSEAQLDGSALAFAWAASEFGIPTTTLAGHRDATATTACPGSSLYAHVASGELRRRVDALLSDGGTVSVRRVCGAEAAAVVADIEAGRR